MIAPALTVVILTMYRTEKVVAAAESVLRQLADGDHLLVFDQCAAECECAQALQSLAGAEANMTVHSDATCSGLAMARNVALTMVRTPLIFFLDDDATLVKGCLQAVREEIARDPSLVGVGVMQRTAPSPLWFRWYRLFRRGVFRDQRQELNIGREKRHFDDAPLPGGGALLRTETARALGFDENYLSYSMGEDVEFSLRLLQVGRTRLIPTAQIDHERAAAARDRSAATEMRDAVVSLHYLLLRLPKRTKADQLDYVWAQVGNGVRALAAACSRKSVQPLRGLAMGWLCILRGFRSVDFLKPRDRWG